MYEATLSTDPFPYILAAYGIGLLLLAGYAASLVLHRRRVTAYLAALKGTYP